MKNAQNALIKRPGSQSPDWEPNFLRISDSVLSLESQTPSACHGSRNRVSKAKGIPNQRLGTSARWALGKRRAFVASCKLIPLLLLVLAAVSLRVDAQTAPPSPPHGANLIPNANFSAADPFQGWRIDFPYEGWYAKNKTYLSVTSEHARNGGKCVQIDLPPGVAGNEGGKIESAFVKATPGATYRVEIDCLTWDFSAKTFVEAWVTDPHPVATPDKFRIPARDGHPALLMVYRAQIPDPKGNSKQWETVARDFTLPMTRPAGGQDMAPEFLSLKAYTYAATMKGGKSYFGTFRLIQK